MENLENLKQEVALAVVGSIERLYGQRQDLGYYVGEEIERRAVAMIRRELMREVSNALGVPYRATRRSLHRRSIDGLIDDLQFSR